MTKTILIYASPNHTPWMVETAGAYVQRLWWVRMSHDYRLLIGDAYGVDQEVVRQCKAWNVPYTCVGINKHPRNQAKSYMRYSSVGSKATYEARDSFMVAMADVVICLENALLPSKEVQAVYRYAKLFDRKQVSLKTFGKEAYEQVYGYARRDIDLLHAMPGTGLARVGDFTYALN